MKKCERWLVLGAVGILIGALPHTAHAEPGTAAAPAAVGSSAMPGYVEVALPQSPRFPAALAADAGYGYTEAIVEEAGGHNRFLGSLALSAGMTDWLMASGELRGRYDVHPDDGGEADSGGTGLPVLRLRAYTGDDLSWGAEFAAALPGGNAPSVNFGAITPELRALLGYESSGGFSFGSNVGYRLDNGAEAAPDPDRLRQGDRIALGLSEYDALLIGVGAGYTFDANSVFVEVSGDLLLGAAEFGTSPLRAGAGYRRLLSRSWQLEARGALSSSQRPDIGPGSELIPIEPLFAGSVGLRYLFGVDKTQERVRSEPEADPEEDLKREAAQPKQPAEAALPSRVSGTVMDADGEPLAQVDVVLSIGEEERTATTDAEGRFAFDDVPKGEGSLEARTVDYDTARVKVEVAGDGEAVELPPVAMKLQALRAQIQGLVQTFGGKPLVATITISPPGEKHETDAEGRFSIDVKPGKYEVEIEASGYTRQEHRVTVGEKAVIVVNAELRKAP